MNRRSLLRSALAAAVGVVAWPFVSKATTTNTPSLADRIAAEKAAHPLIEVEAASTSPWADGLDVLALRDGEAAPSWRRLEWDAAEQGWRVPWKCEIRGYRLHTSGAWEAGT